MAMRPPVRYKSHRHLEDYLFPIAMTIVGLLVAAVMVFAVYSMIQAQRDCEAVGGVYESDGECEVDGRDLVEYD